MTVGQRPSEIAGYSGSQLERILFDAAVLQEASRNHGEPHSTYEKIMQRRRTSGVYA